VRGALASLPSVPAVTPQMDLRRSRSASGAGAGGAFRPAILSGCFFSTLARAADVGTIVRYLILLVPLQFGDAGARVSSGVTRALPVRFVAMILSLRVGRWCGDQQVLLASSSVRWPPLMHDL
jgi:hypothetical protein